MTIGKERPAYCIEASLMTRGDLVDGLPPMIGGVSIGDMTPDVLRAYGAQMLEQAYRRLDQGRRMIELANRKESESV